MKSRLSMSSRTAATGSCACLGLADKRVGLLVDGPARAVECVADQVTEDAWAGVAKRALHIGEEEFRLSMSEAFYAWPAPSKARKADRRRQDHTRTRTGVRSGGNGSAGVGEGGPTSRAG